MAQNNWVQCDCGGSGEDHRPDCYAYYFEIRRKKQFYAKRAVK